MESSLKQKILKVQQLVFRPYHPRFSLGYMLIIIVSMSLYYNYQEILFYRPQSVHQWRQCDGLSFALNYYQDNNPLLQPSTHFLGSDLTGKAAAEFPLLYYFTAKLWKIFGYHEYIFRLVNLLIFVFGLIALMKIFEDVLKDSFLSVITVLLLFTSPVMVYYANNFVPNIPSFGLAMIAWYLFWLFYKTGKSAFFYFSIGLFALAGLTKVTAVISLIALSAVFFLDATGISKFKNGSRLFKYPYIQWIPFILAFGLIFSWYYYASYYNNYHGSAIFTVGINPIWSLTKEQILEHFRGIKNQIKFSYFDKSIYWLLLVACILILINIKKANKLLLFLTLLTFIGIIGFFLFHFIAFSQHDYYVIDLIFFVPLTCLTFMNIIKNHYAVLFKSIFPKLIIIILLINNAGFAKQMMADRYSIAGRNDNYLRNIKRFENITPYLRAIGIEADDKVLCLPDESPNITLYFMNQKGWTNYSTNMDSTRIKYKINAGADYLFIYIDSVYNNPNIRPFIANKIGEINDIDIYDISSFRIKRTEI